MSAHSNNPSLPSISSSLEDYLETIFLLVQQNGFARVKEIARARAVKAASVSIALRKLAELELVRYERREYVALTETGEQLGRRVLSRHRILTRFFEQVLQMPAAAAEEQACAMEHSLSDDAMDRLARFFEHLGSCPNVPADLLASFQACPVGETGKRGAAPCACSANCRALHGKAQDDSAVHLSDLSPGQKARVARIGGQGALRQRLLDLGILPDAPVDLERFGLGGDPVWIRCQGSQLALRRSEARSILVVPIPS
jgi:DtxR family Mn-dependent transcriptional regulator